MANPLLFERFPSPSLVFLGMIGLERKERKVNHGQTAAFAGLFSVSLLWFVLAPSAISVPSIGCAANHFLASTLFSTPPRPTRPLFCLCLPCPPTAIANAMLRWGRGSLEKGNYMRIVRRLEGTTNRARRW